MSGPSEEALHELPESVRSAVATLAARPLGMSLIEWNLVASTLLQAADEIERLRKRVDELNGVLSRDARNTARLIRLGRF